MTTLLFLLLSMPQANATVSKSDMDNVRLQISRGWFVDAEANLTALVQSPQGEEDGAAWLHLARLRASMGFIPKARVAATNAVNVARPTLRFQELSVSYLRYLEEGFGLLRAKSPRAATVGTLEIVATRLPGGNETVEYIALANKRLSSPTNFPADVWLPIGTYEICEQTIQITAGAVRDVICAQRALYGDSSALLHDLFIEAGAGVGGWIGDQSMHPEPSLGASLGLYTGRIVWRFGVNKSGWIYQPSMGPTARDSKTLPTASIGYAIRMSSPINAQLTLEGQQLSAPSVLEDGTVEGGSLSAVGLGLSGRSSHRLGMLQLTFGMRTVLLAPLEDYALPTAGDDALHLSTNIVMAIAN
jgi:hypothetical protein